MKESLISSHQDLSRERGFSLIESLLSMTIISLSLFFVVSVFPLVARNIHQNEIQNVAFFLATAKVEDFIAQGYNNLEEGAIIEDYGEIDFYGNYKRVIAITCFHPERACQSEETGMKRIDVEVFHSQSLGGITDVTSLITAR